MAQREAVDTVFATNPSARHNYEIVESLEVGLALSGAEVKSIRAGNVTIKESYARERAGELFLLGCHIGQYNFSHDQRYNPTRERKLLAHRREIEWLRELTMKKGLTLIPLKLYLVRGRVKLELGAGRGKKLFDKRESSRSRDASRELARIVKRQRASAVLLAGLGMVLQTACTPIKSCEVSSAEYSQVSAVRGLPFTSSVPCYEVTRDYLSDRVRENVQIEQSQLRDDTRLAFKFLGVVRQGREGQQLRASEPAGYYDEHGERLFLLRGLTRSQHREVLAHELTHVLQDQHLKLLEFRALSASYDERTSRRALLEGDAVVTSGVVSDAEVCNRFSRAHLADYLQGVTTHNERPLSAQQLILQILGELPYAAGARLVCDLHKNGGTALVTKAFRNPPLRSFDVLFPERYIERLSRNLEPSVRFSLSPGMLDGSEGRLGHFFLLAYLMPATNAATALQLVSGVESDLFVVEGARFVWQFETADALVATQLVALLGKVASKLDVNATFERAKDQMTMTILARE